MHGPLVGSQWLALFCAVHDPPFDEVSPHCKELGGTFLQGQCAQSLSVLMR